MRRAACVAIAALALAGCGGSPGNTIQISMSGVGPAQSVLVTENGQGSCNNGPLKQLASNYVLNARDLAGKLKKLASSAASFPSPGGRTFKARTLDGTVTWGETYKPLPQPLPQVELLGLQLSQTLCA
jgi:hypothetical protein